MQLSCRASLVRCAVHLYYLHGFASGPGSAKGVAFERYLAARGRAIARLDLRRPSLAHLRLSAMIDHVRATIEDPAILIGSSLGGLTAARVAERDPRVKALVLLAPAFGFAARWRERLGEAGMASWRDTGALRVHDHATGGDADVDYGFFLDAEVADSGGDPDVRVPTAIFHGVRDDVIPIERSRAFARARSNVRLTELDDGHELIASLPTILPAAVSLLGDTEARAGS